MTENILLSLQITLIGMGLVFAALILLWLLMMALTAMTAGRKKRTGQDNATEKQAAAIAVAIALAEQKQSTVSRFPTPPTALLSAWQLSMRNRQMKQGE